jgi:hypothetical protein
MMNNLWVYEGNLDEAANVLPLHTEGPSMKREQGITKYKDVIEVKSDQEREMKSFMQSEDGQWVPVMTARYRRKS